MLKLHFAILLIASSRKTRNSQSLESRNQNPTYGISGLFCSYYITVTVITSRPESQSEKKKSAALWGNYDETYEVIDDEIMMKPMR